MLMLSFVLTLGASFAVTYAPDYEVFAAARFFVGMGTAGTRNAGYILSEFQHNNNCCSILIVDMTTECEIMEC